MPASRDIRRQQQRSRSLLLALSRNALQEAGQRLSDARASEQHALRMIGQQVNVALRAGMRISEIAELTGLTRQKVYELRDAHGDSAEDLEALVLTQLAASGGQSVEGLVGQLRDVDADGVRRMLADLQQRGLVRVAATHYGTDETFDQSLLITPDGEAHLEELLAAEPGLVRLSVYVAFDPDERPALEAAARDVFGTERFSIIEPGTASDVVLPELAFFLVAADGQQAISLARGRMAEVRAAAGLEPRLPEYIVVAPAGG
jgi:DNA-binding MarR family transcriptional regulator